MNMFFADEIIIIFFKNAAREELVVSSLRKRELKNL